MGSEGHARVVTALGRALSRHDARAAAACYAENAIYREVGTGLAVRGRAAIETVTREVLNAFPDATFGLGRVVPGSGGWTVEWWAEGTHLGLFRNIPPTGARFRLQAASVLQFSGGLIAVETVYLNAAALLRQAAVAQPHQSTPVQRYLQALMRHDPEAAAACFIPDGRREVVGEGCAEGRAAIAAQWRSLLAAVPGLQLELELPEGRGALVAVRYRLHVGRQGAACPGLSVFSLCGDSIALETVYSNGLAPSARSGAVAY